MTRPNILFLMSDEHRADVAGFAGNPVVRTPVLDELAATGITFTNAYTPSPICVPCRQSLASGQLPRTCGVEHYGRDLPPFSMTFARRLTQHGYGTVCCGKLHHDGPDQMQGWMRRIGGNCRLSWNYVDGLSPDAGVAADPSVNDGKWSDAKELTRAGVGSGTITHTPDRLALQGALEFINERFVSPYYDKGMPSLPTLLMLSFNRPHYPYFTREDLFRYYLTRVEPYLEDDAFDHPFLSKRRVRPGIDASPREFARATAAYYGMIEEIDTDYGTTLNALRDANQDPDDWWIVYTADHGEMLGQHGIWEKQKFFEASARVPLIIRPPRALRDAWGCAGKTIDANVNLCDLFASLCDMADVPLPEDAETVNGAGLDSRSLLPLMRGEVKPGDGWDDETISQFDGTNVMIKHGPLKYQRYDRVDCADQPEVLFDLVAEPEERRNLIDEPRYAKHIATFRQRCAALAFGPDADPAYRNAGYR
ncbi:MAG: sulfatase-like hydrolase/transferase [Planctomycetota bacterium]